MGDTMETVALGKQQSPFREQTRVWRKPSSSFRKPDSPLSYGKIERGRKFLEEDLKGKTLGVWHQRILMLVLARVVQDGDAAGEEKGRSIESEGNDSLWGRGRFLEKDLDTLDQTTLALKETSLPYSDVFARRGAEN